MQYNVNWQLKIGYKLPRNNKLNTDSFKHRQFRDFFS